MNVAVLQHARRPSVRLLILGWSVWLLTLWAMLWSEMGVNHRSVQLLVFGAAVGMFAAWPALRLSQWTSIGGVLLDWLALNLLWQAVLWPLMTIARWPVDQALWLAVAMGGWSLAVGWLIALGGMWDRGDVRTGMMGVCMLLLLGEPAWMAMPVGDAWPAWISPIAALWALTARPGYFQPQPWTGRVSVITSIAVGAWAALLMFRGICVRMKLCDRM